MVRDSEIVSVIDFGDLTSGDPVTILGQHARSSTKQNGFGRCSMSTTRSARETTQHGGIETPMSTPSSRALVAATARIRPSASSSSISRRSEARWPDRCEATVSLRSGGRARATAAATRSVNERLAQNAIARRSSVTRSATILIASWLVTVACLARRRPSRAAPEQRDGARTASHLQSTDVTGLPHSLSVRRSGLFDRGRARDEGGVGPWRPHARRRRRSTTCTGEPAGQDLG